MNKHEFKFIYTDHEFLDRLVDAIPEEGYSLSVHLMPDEDELVEKSMLKQSLRSPSLVLSEDLKKEALADEQLYDLIMFPLWKKYDVIPFQSLVFDYINGGSPEIAFCGSHSQLEEDPLKYRHPNLFIGNKRWFQVSMINGERPQDIRLIKEATSGFLFDGYTLVYVSAEQNSALNREGYYSQDALLTATCGECEIYGRKPEKFKSLVEKLL